METERLIVRRYLPEDKTNFVELFTDAAVMKHVGDGVMTEAQAEAFWQKLFEELYPKNFNIWAILTKDSADFVGHAGIYPRPANEDEWEFVYFFNTDNWGKGYATEIAQRIIEYGFEELNLPRVFATVDDDHSLSIRVLEKAGMGFERYEYDDEGSYSVYSVKRQPSAGKPPSAPV